MAGFQGPAIVVQALLLVRILHGACSLSTTASFEDYIIAFGRNYVPGSAEYDLRHSVFRERARTAVAQNARPDRLWTASLNDLADRTDAELRQLRGWRRAGSPRRSPASFLLGRDSHPARSLPEEVSWANLSAVVQPSNQGACGSCWAFSAASMLSARYQLATGEERMFSPQQMVDCVPNDQHCGGTGGCNGATVELAMKYVQDMGLAKLRTSLDVPYRGHGRSCESNFASTRSARNSRFSSLFQGIHLSRAGHEHTQVGHESRGRVQLSGWQTLPSNQAAPLMQALMEGPVSISVAATEWSLYSSGIFNGCPRDSVIDHAVLLTGYGVDDSIGYWTVKNSWGSGWGEGGFIRVFRHSTPEEDQEYCGIDKDPSAGVACEPYPDEVEVCGMCGLLYDSVVPQLAAPEWLRASHK